MAGPNRPAPRLDPEVEAARVISNAQKDSSPRTGASGASRAGAVASETTVGQDIYSRFANAVSERGCVLVSHVVAALPALMLLGPGSELLSGIEESFNSLEAGSREMAEQVML